MESSGNTQKTGYYRILLKKSVQILCAIDTLCVVDYIINLPPRFVVEKLKPE